MTADGENLCFKPPYPFSASISTMLFMKILAARTLFLDIRQLEIFVKIVSCGNFSKAARELYLTQPTVSSHIHALEEELGISLFERRSREAVLTDGGKQFYPYALNILMLKEQGMEKALHFKGTVQGVINISSSSTPGIYILPLLLKPFEEQFTAVSFNVSISNTDQVISKVLNYEADLGFVGGVYFDDPLRFLPVHEDTMVVVAPLTEKYKAMPSSISFEDVEDEKFIMRAEGSFTRKVFASALQQNNKSIDELNVSLEINSIEGAKNCVQKGMGITVMPEICVSETDAVKVFYVEDLDLRREFFAVYRGNRVFSPSLKKFISFLQEEWCL